ncbi:hypothetical protein [Streptomyces syringium]|uniref:hypothetical protein n=1 Tax=Streptomyces syringium TaxID=76729 RepID=UPI0034086BBE
MSDHADEVVVLEPDGLVENGIGRGAPQREQLHALLAMGHSQLERWFPGLTNELTEAGAQLGTGAAIQFYIDGALKTEVPDLRMIGATRSFIEAHVRRRLSDLPNVSIRAGQARDLIIKGSRVCGVRFSSVEGTPPTSTIPDGELDADLVVDAMGRSTRLGTWLQHHGWDPAPLDRMRVDLGYATATFHRGNELPGTVIAHATPGPASAYQPALSEPGALAAVEGNRWTVVLAGYTDYRPGRDPEEFLTRMRRCVAPLQMVADQCAMDGEVKTYHFRESIRRDYTRLTRLPGGLVAVGDSVASVNPIYGQGLTLAALQASALSAYLRRSAYPHSPAWEYFRLAGAVVSAAWQLSATADLAQPHVTGPYPQGYRLIRWVSDKITSASVIDPVVNQTFMDVLHMRAHPRNLTHPRVLLRASRVLLTR